MKSALFVFTILLLTVPVSAQPVAGTAAEKCTVEGQVVAAGTGQPLKKARLLLDKMEARMQPFLAVTDAAGRFKFSEIEPGRYLLSVWRNGYVNQQFGQRSSNRRPTVLALEPGQHMQDIVFRLVRHAVIAGRVYDEDGEPVPRVNVQVLRYRYVGSERQLAPAGAGSTNDLGEYRIYDLPPGRYYVSADYSPRFRAFTRAQIRRSMGGRQSTDAESYAPTYYPGTNDPAYATPIELRAGDELSSIDFNLSPTRTVRVSGRVVNTISGKPGLNTSVVLLPRTSLRRRAFLFRNRVSVDNSEGTFEIRGVVPGSYILTATYIHQEEGQQYATRLPIEVESADIEGITLVIERGMDLSARIYVEGAAPPSQPGPGAAAGQTQDRFDMTEVRMYLSPYDDLPLLPSPRSGKASGDGSLRVKNVAPSRYRVNVVGLPRDYYLKSARVGGQDVLEAGLDLTGGAPPNPLEITISGAGGRIDGSVLTEEQESFGGASVVLVPEERRRDQRRFYKSATTDQNGAFTLRGIPPGDYKLFAWEEIERGAYRDPAFLRPYEDRGESVQVREGDQLSVQLQLIPADSPPR